jgi:hypothetical protein
MKNLCYLTLLLVLLFSNEQVAVGQSAGVNTVTPNNNAALDIQNFPSKNQGLLIPRMPASAKSTFGLGTADKGMIFYGSDTDSIYYWTGIKWVTVQLASAPASGPWTRSSPNVQLTNTSDNVGIGVLPSGTKFEIRGIDATPTNLALRITNSTAATLMTVSNNGDIAFPLLGGPGIVTTNTAGKLTLVTGTPVLGVGVANKVAFWNSTGAALATNTNFHWDDVNTRLGLQTAAPSQTFSVAEKFLVDGTSGSASFTDPTGSIKFPNVTGTPNPMMYMFASGASNSDRMVIAHSLTSPTYGLQYKDVGDQFVFLGNGNPVMNINLAAKTVSIPPLVGPGIVKTDATGLLSLTNDNLLPIAFGSVYGNAIVSGSGNFTLTRNSAGNYSITISGESYYFSSYTTVVTPLAFTGFVTTNSVSGNLLIYTYSATGVQTDAGFQFVVYKP